MKQIFDWLREQINSVFRLTDSYEFLDSRVVFSIIDEAEAKWESECCKQWDLRGNATFMTIHSVFYLADEAKCWKFCPHCGKPIKISEVE